MRRETLARPFVIAALTAAAALPASAQWASDPALNSVIADGAPGQVLPKIAPTADGGCWISWFATAPSPNFYTVRINRLDVAGNKLLGPDGILVSDFPHLSFTAGDYDLRADSGGNALLIFNDVRGGTDREVTAYRISPAGAMLWGASGVQLSDNTVDEFDARIVQTSDGLFTAVWQRSNSGASPERGLLMQRLDASGAKLLAPEGVLIAGSGVGGSAAGEGPGFIEMVASDGGAVIVLFAKDARIFSSPRHPSIQKFDASGAGLWNGGSLTVLNASPIPLGARMNLVSDGAAGAIAAWYDTRRGGTNFDSWVQRISAAGTQAFPAGGSAVSTSNTDRAHINPSDPVPGPSGETYIFWREQNLAQSQWGVYGQRFDAAGARQWTDAGRELVAVDTTNESFIRAGRAPGCRAGAIVLYKSEPNSGLQNDSLFAIRVDGDGNPVWNNSPLPVATTLSEKGRLPAVSASDAGLLAAWEDQRTDTGGDIYAQRINPAGTLGPPPCRGDFNSSGAISVQDIFDFLAAYFASDPSADINNCGGVTVQDIFDFLAAYFAGCP